MSEKLKKLLLRLWNTKPFYIFAAIVAVQIVFQPSFDFLYLLGLITVLAFFQNSSYSIQSRASARSSNFYHSVGAIVASLAFFLSFRTLFKNGAMPPYLLPVYMMGTIMGNVYGATLAEKIEKFFNIRVLNPEEKERLKKQPQLMRFWPSIIFLVIVLIFQVLLIPSPIPSLILFGLAAVSMVDSVVFAVARISRNTNHHWFHAVAVLIQLCVQFTRLKIMTDYQMDWLLFWPLTTGSVMGSLIGAYIAINIEGKLKAEYDSHVTKKKKIPWPRTQTMVLSFGLVIHVIIFGFTNWWMLSILLFSAFAQNTSFTLISRARQRNNKPYIAWASVLSNGVWYLTMHQLVKEDITLNKAAPYVVGCTTGGLFGQTAAMYIEKTIGAVMDSGPDKKEPEAKTAKA